MPELWSLRESRGAPQEAAKSGRRRFRCELDYSLPFLPCQRTSLKRGTRCLPQAHLRASTAPPTPPPDVDTRPCRERCAGPRPMFTRSLPAAPESFRRQSVANRRLRIDAPIAPASETARSALTSPGYLDVVPGQMCGLDRAETSHVCRLAIRRASHPPFLLNRGPANSLRERRNRPSAVATLRGAKGLPSLCEKCISWSV